MIKINITQDKPSLWNRNPLNILMSLHTTTKLRDYKAMSFLKNSKLTNLLRKCNLRKLKLKESVRDIYNRFKNSINSKF